MEGTGKVRKRVSLFWLLEREGDASEIVNRQRGYECSFDMGVNGRGADGSLGR